MKVKNISESTIHLVNFLGEKNSLVLSPNEISKGFVPNKNRLNTLVNHSKKLEIYVDSANELELVSELDSRVSSLVKL